MSVECWTERLEIAARNSAHQNPQWTLKASWWLVDLWHTKATAGRLSGGPSDLYLLVATPLHNPFPLSVGETCELLLTNRIWQRWQDVIFMTMLHKIVTSILLVDSLFLCLCLSFSFSSSASPGTANNHVSLGVIRSPIELSDETQPWLTSYASLWETMKQRTQLSCAWFLDPQKLI